MSHLMEAFYSYTEKSQFFNAKGKNSLLSMWYYIAKKLNTQFSYDNFLRPTSSPLLPPHPPSMYFNWTLS